MEAQRNLDFKGGNEKASSPSSKDKMHITAKGREGRALRKKLAIAMGLRISSSGTPSTIDSDEELDLPDQESSSQNVMELFREQMKETAAKKRNISSHQQTSDQALNEAFRKTVYRRTTTTTREFLSDEDDTDGRERSMDHVTRSANTRSSHDITESQDLVENSKINKQLTAQHDVVNKSVSVNNNASQSEEIFSSYGEQDDSSRTIKSTSDDSMKLLRERIRKNARARLLPTPKSSGGMRSKEKEMTNTETSTERNSNYQSTQRKNSGSSNASQIPVRIERKTSETGAERMIQEKDIQENQVQNLKTKIPRRKSQNATDRKASFKKNDSGFSESLLTEIFQSSTVKNEKNSPKIKVGVQESRRQRNSNEEIVAMNVTQELHLSESSSLFDSVATEKSNKKSTPVPALKVKNILRELQVADRNKSNTTAKVSSNTTSRKKDTVDFDAILAELANLKASVFKTYDDLHDLNEHTLDLRKELKEMRNI